MATTPIAMHKLQKWRRQLARATQHRQYRYSNLKNEDIRILDLLPGEVDDEIRIVIRHVPFEESPPTPNDGGLSLSKLRESLKDFPGWGVDTTHDGRHVFFKEVKEGRYLCNTSWDHPDPKIDPSLYKNVPQKMCAEPEFEALSYVWGTDEPTNYVRVVDETTGKSSGVIWVRKNLFAALRRLRETESRRTLWIDALSINQRDGKEKERQVRRMANIYNSANRVVIWLGEATKDSGLALGALDQLGSLVGVTVFDMIFALSDEIHQRYPGAFDGQPSLDPETLEAVDNLLRNDWFSRLWVVQESHLASSSSIIQCGAVIMSITNFRTATELLDNQHLGGPIRGIHLRPFQVTSLGRILFKTRFKLCSDPRDKVYAILGFLDPEIKRGIKVDYSRSVTPPDVYRQLFVAHATTVRRLDCFYSVSLTGRSVSNTWLPDLSCPSLRNNHIIYGGNPVGNSRAEFSVDEKGVLHALGVRCGRVARVSKPMPFHFSQLGQHISDFVGGEEGPEKSLKVKQCVTALCGYFYTERWVHSLGVGIDEMTQMLFSQDGEESVVGNQSRNYSRTLVQNPARFSHLLELEDGSFGKALCCPYYLPGDEVIVLLGSSFPLLVRAVGENAYQFLDACYFSSLADATSLLGPIPDGWTVKEGGNQVRFVKCDTGEMTFYDPRLPELSKEWEMTEETLLQGGRTAYCVPMRNVRTGEFMNSDPRMLPDELRKRGVKLEMLSIV